MFWRHRTPIDGTGRAPIDRFCTTALVAAALWVRNGAVQDGRGVSGRCAATGERHVTQRELASRLGKPQSFVSEYERGQRRVDVVEFAGHLAGARC